MSVRALLLLAAHIRLSVPSTILPSPGFILYVCAIIGPDLAVRYAAHRLLAATTKEGSLSPPSVRA